jgi:hypothetical protein
MAFISVHRAAMFLEDEYIENPVTHEMNQVIKNQITVYPNPPDYVPQEVPEWAEYDELYDLGIQEGWLVATTEQSARAAQDRAKKQKDGDKETKVPVGMPQQQTSWKK